jgi:C4-dicarboxylate transporter, DctQ subunit
MEVMILKLLDNIEELLIVTSLATMVVINFGNVVSRYVIHASWAFSEELMVILFVYNSFLGASVAYKRGAHLGFTVLTELLPLKIQKLVIYLTGFLTITLMVILAKAGMEMVNSQFLFDQRTPALGLPEWIAGISVPLGSLLIVVRVIQSCLSEVRLLEVRTAGGDNTGGDK